MLSIRRRQRNHDHTCASRGSPQFRHAHVQCRVRHTTCSLHATSIYALTAAAAVGSLQYVKAAAATASTQQTPRGGTVPVAPWIIKMTIAVVIATTTLITNIITIPTSLP